MSAVLSPAAELEAYKQRVVAQAAELEAKLEEARAVLAQHEELTTVMRQLGLNGATAKTPARRRRRAAAPSSGNGAGRKVAEPFTRDEQVKSIVREHPDGITVRALGERLGLDPTGLYRVIRRLEQAGEVAKANKLIVPASGPEAVAA